jgi:hypothetical protein
MAKKKPAADAPTTPDKALVQQVTDDVLASYEAQRAADAPEGTQAALFGPGGKAAFKRVVSAFAGNVLEIALMARDGRMDLAEARRLFEMVVEAASKAQDSGDGPAVLG